jgi:hypothetical protein
MFTAGNRHKQNSWFCKEIREDIYLDFNLLLTNRNLSPIIFRLPWWKNIENLTCIFVKHVKNWNFLFYCSNIAKSENAMLWRMLSRLETCIVYSCIWSVTLAKLIVPRKTWRKLWHSYISKLFLFSIFFHHGSLHVIGDKFRFVRSKLKSR